ncbi:MULTISPECIES: hypothetical protein [Nocardiopsis]|uniref:Uncharacterized protein n=1 Tax=Nocardiopsis sinuspersici TaxID=501010 RepID=A0A1V3C5Z1_9ACTN|nr:MULTISPECIES: hypothetical protein [Nocardiopsis]OOC56214.1 hypothetical protein NOSIN_22270 [Nocardiopsis sinuspersici]
MVQETRAVSDVVELARRLRRLSPGKWTEADLRAMAADQGWEWVDGERGPCLRAEEDFGEARLRPVDEFMEIHVTTEEYVGLHFLVKEVRGGVGEHVEAFGEIAESLREEFVEPHVLGADDTSASFHDDIPRWGAPFMRWRGRGNSLELRAGTEGPVLSLLPGDPAEGWFWYNREHGAETVGGFIGTRPVRDNAGMSFAGITRHTDWKEYGRLLADSLRTLPAELTALGLSRSFGFHGRVPGTSGPWVFQFELGEHVELGLDDAVADLFGPESPTPEELGWTRATEERHLRQDIAYHSPRYPYDEVNGVRLAMMVIETAEALGIPSPSDLSLTDWADHVGFPSEEGSNDNYHVIDYGLAVTANP